MTEHNFTLKGMFNRMIHPNVIHIYTLYQIN